MVSWRGILPERWRLTRVCASFTDHKSHCLTCTVTHSRLSNFPNSRANPTASSSSHSFFSIWRVLQFLPSDKDGFVGVFGRKESFWWSCVKCCGRSYLPRTLHRLPLFSASNDLISKSFPPGLYEQKINWMLFFFLPCFFPFSFLFIPWGSSCCKSEKIMQEVRIQSCNSRIKDLFFVFFSVCIYLKEAVQPNVASLLRCSHSQ